MSDNYFLSVSDSVSEDEPVQRIPPSAGPLLAIVGGTLYAVGALLASYAEVYGDAWPARRKTIFRILSFLSLITGGLSVTFCYMSGNPVPLMNATVYATNLGLNMLFQIAFQVSVYTKVMRNGTILFAFATVMLGDMAPPPEVPAPTTDDLLGRMGQPLSIVFVILFVALCISCVSLLKGVAHFSRSSSIKQLAWALTIACTGSFTDNWAKILGTLTGTNYTIQFAIYSLAGIGVMVLSVYAMTQCDVAIYVPANLCSQLVLNVIADFMVWGVGERVPKVVPYVIGYVLCVMGVYILAPEADLGTAVTTFIEHRSASLSKGIGKTAFGRAMINVGQSWKSQKQEVPSDGAKTPLTSEEALAKLIKEGHDCRAFTQENMIELMLVLWRGNNKGLGPTTDILTWLHNTAYFKDYFEKDPDFARILAEGLSPDMPLPEGWPSSRVEMQS